MCEVMDERLERSDRDAFNAVRQVHQVTEFPELVHVSHITPLSIAVRRDFVWNFEVSLRAALLLHKVCCIGDTWTVLRSFGHSASFCQI